MDATPDGKQHYYPEDLLDVERTSVDEAAALALSGQLTHGAPFYDLLRPRAIAGLRGLYFRYPGTRRAAAAKRTALQLGAEAKRFPESRNVVSQVFSGGLPGQGKGQ